MIKTFVMVKGRHCCGHNGREGRGEVGAGCWARKEVIRLGEVEHLGRESLQRMALQRYMNRAV